MKLLPVFLFTILSLFTASLGAQVYYSMTFSLVDQSNQPIRGAIVSIKELGYQSVKTSNDGKAYFSDVPVGEIHYFVICDGYTGVDGSFNITTIDKNNTKRISLSKIPTPKSNVLLISGEVVDDNNNDIQGAEVEVSAGNYTLSTVSNESGRYNIEFDLDKVRFNVTDVEIEVKKDNCKSEEKIIIPKNNYLYKNIILTCSSTGGPAQNISCVKREGEWDIKVIGCRRDGNNVICDLEFKSNFKDRDLQLTIWGNSPPSFMYDDLGNEYKAVQGTLGDVQGNGSSIRKRIIANIPIRGTIYFSNISTQAKKISLLDITVRGDGIVNRKIQCRDLPIN